MPLAPINLPKSSIFFGNFCKGVKIYHFSSEIIFGHLLKTFGDFYWSHCNQHNLSFLAHITSAVHCQYTFSCLSALFPFTLSLSLSLSSFTHFKTLRKRIYDKEKFEDPRNKLRREREEVQKVKARTSV